MGNGLKLIGAATVAVLGIAAGCCVFTGFLTSKSTRDAIHASAVAAGVRDGGASGSVPPATYAVTTSVVRFESGSLVECTEATIEGPASERAAIDVRLAGIFRQAADAGVQTIDGTCASAFGDRQVWATCTDGPRPSEQTPSVTTLLRAHFYDFGDVYNTDERTQECIGMHGSWSAQRRDTREWRRANAEARLADVQREIDRTR